MRKQTGTVVARKGKYFVKVGEQMHELQPGPLGGENTLKAIVGQKVRVILTQPEVAAIVTKKVPVACYSACFICYKPVNVFRSWIIDPAIREQNLKAFLDEGLISKEVFDSQMSTI